MLFSLCSKLNFDAIIFNYINPAKAAAAISSPTTAINPQLPTYTNPMPPSQKPAHKPNLYHRPPFKNLTTYRNIPDTTTESSHNPTNHEQNTSTIMDLPSSTPSHHKHNQPNNIRTKSNHPNQTPISKDCCQRPSVSPTTTNPSKPCSRTTKRQTQFTTNSTLKLTSTTSNQINQSESIPKIQMNQNPYIT